MLAVRRQDPLCEAGEFHFQVAVAHGVVRTAHSMLDELLEAAAVPGGQNNSNLVFVERGIHDRGDTVTKGSDRCVADRAIAELRYSAAPFDEGDRSRVIDAELSLDRKSTRLNSSHVAISYAVFCLKKKT